MKKFLVLALSLAIVLVSLSSCKISPTTPDEAPTAGNALEYYSTVTMGGTGTYSNWFGQTSTASDGTDALQSGNTAHSSTTWFEITVSSANYVDFYWKVSSEGIFDRLSVYVDGFLETSISGETAWNNYSINLGGGTHDIRWVYSKDSTNSYGSDAGWVDDIYIH